jgi:MFS transporter, putative metabolite:H+ symporter
LPHTDFILTVRGIGVQFRGMNNTALLHRFDQARLEKFHLILMLLTGSCWSWAAYGVTIVGFILPALKNEWNVSSSALGFLAGIGMLGMLAGSVAAGTLSDHYGRRRMLTWIMYYLGVMFILSAVAGSYTVLLVLRFFTGMGLGAILPTGGTLVSEFSPIKQRGTLLVLLNGFWGLGGTLAALIGYSLVLHTGWRPAMLFGGLSIVSGLLIQWLLPESLRFLLSKGQVDRAQKESARVHLVEILPDPEIQENISPSSQPISKPRNGLWSHRFARTTFSLWFLWVSLNFLYQGVFVWLPTLLAGTDSSASRSFLLTFFISLGQIPGTLLVAYLADRYSRRRLIILSLGLLGLAAIVFSLSGSTAWVLIIGFTLMVFNGMAWGLAHPFSSELYPTSIRGTATGWATGIGRLGGVVAPVVVAWVMQAGGGMTTIFSILAAAPALTMVVLGGLKQETTGRSLEEIST